MLEPEADIGCFQSSMAAFMHVISKPAAIAAQVGPLPLA